MIRRNGRGTLVLRTWHDARARRRRARRQRRRARRARRRAAADLRSVLHDEGGRQRDRPGAHRRLRHRPGARRPDHAEIGAGRRRVVLRGAAGRSRPAQADAAARPNVAAPADVGPGVAVLVVEDEAALGAAVAEALGRRLPGGSRERRSRGARAAAQKPVRPDHLRSEDAAARRHRVLSRARVDEARRWRGGSCSSPATSRAPMPSDSSRRAAAAGSPSRSG